MKAFLATLCCVSVLFARPAHAAAPARAAARLELEKRPGTEQCIDARALARAVEIRLRRPAFRKDLPATLYVQIRVERSASVGWSAEITMRDGSGASLGTRAIATQAAHCSALDDSLALVVALLVAEPPTVTVVEPNHETEPVVPAAPPAPAASEARPVAARTGAATSATILPVTDSTITLPRDTPARRQPWLFDLSLEGAAAVGFVPGVAAGVELSVTGKPPLWPAIRLFGGLYPVGQEQRAGANSGARFSFADVGLALCPLDLPLGAIHWVGCAGQSLGWVRVAAFGFDENTTTTHLSYALLISTSLNIPLVGALAGRLGVRAEVPLQRGIFTYGARAGGERGLFEMKSVAGVLDAGLIVRL